MRIVRDARRPPELPRGAVVTIGNYDGLHRGQRAILERVVGSARARGAFSALVTFFQIVPGVRSPGPRKAKANSTADTMSIAHIGMSVMACLVTKK